MLSADRLPHNDYLNQVPMLICYFTIASTWAGNYTRFLHEMVE